MFMTNNVLQVSLNYGTAGQNYQFDNLALWGNHSPDGSVFMNILYFFEEFQQHSLWLTRAYDPRCWMLDISRADRIPQYLPMHHVASNQTSWSRYAPLIRLEKKT